MSADISASLVLKSTAVFDGTGSEPFAGNVAIAADSIVAVGDDADVAPYIDENTEVRDFGDKLVMPGFNDSHAHMTYGAFLDNPDFCTHLWDCKSLDAALAQVKEFADAHPENEWVFAPHAIQFQWERPEMPTAKEIDAVIPDRPVVIQQVDFHTLSANTCAMEKAGITRDTPDPYGGTILRDADGEPTGVFSNSATFMFTLPIYSPSKEVGKAVYREFLQKCSKLGLTTIANLYPEGTGYDDKFAILAELEREGDLNMRLDLYTGLEDDTTVDEIEEIRQRYSQPGSLIQWRGLKQIVDGVCSDHTAYMLDPYTNAPDTCGQPAMDLDRLHKSVLMACEAGYAVRLHTIGDAAVRWALDTFEEAEKLYGKKGLRHCMEHDETIHPDDLPRYSQLGVSPAMQPMHMVLDLADKAKDDAVGPERATHSWPLRSLLDSGANVNLGTDFPIVEIDPLHEVYGAVTRQLFDGTPDEGWFPEERITLAEALKCYTANSAYAEGAENEKGTLAPGLYADVIVLDRNLFAVKPQELLEAQVELTLVGGKVVYEA